MDRRSDADVEALTAALDGQREQLPRVRANLLLQHEEAVDLFAIDGDDAIAVLHSRLRGGRAGLHVSDPGGQIAVRRGVHREVEDQREEEIGRRPREGDGRLLPGRLLQEAPALVLRRKLLERVVAGELHVAAERKERDAVLGLPPLHPEQPGAEPDRESHRLDAQPLADQQVSQLVEEDDDADEHREGDQRQAGRVHPGDHCAQCNVHDGDFQHRFSEGAGGRVHTRGQTEQ